MDPHSFQQTLQAEGYEQFTTVQREPLGFLDMHIHPFESKALILDGEISIRIGNEEVLYRPGDVFHLPRAQAHAERYGPAGVSYLVGRR